MDDAAPCRSEDGGQFVAVAIFSRSPQPVGAADRLGQCDGGGDVLARDRPHRVRKDDLVGGDVESSANVRRCPDRGLRGEPVVDPGRVESSIGELATGQLVDDHMSPCRIIDREFGDVGEVRPLPRRVVVVHHRWPSSAHVGYRTGCGEVQRNRAEVLDHDQIGVGEYLPYGVCVGGNVGTDLESGYGPVDRPLTGDGERVEPQGGHSVLPVLRHDRHTVGETQPK
jgi:hypothetical protein